MIESLTRGSAQEGGTTEAPPLLFSPYRLPKEAFDALFTAPQARSLAHRAFILRWRRVSTNRPRVGVIATKRTFHRAVDRNRARRLLREVFRLERPMLRPGYDLVLLARQDILKMPFADLQEAFRMLVKRAHIQL